jgi:hypothetical protein
MTVGLKPGFVLGRGERPRPGTAEEAAQLLRRDFKAAGALAYVILPDGGIRSSFSGAPSLLVQMPGLLRRLADDYERRLEIRVQ